MYLFLFAFKAEAQAFLANSEHLSTGFYKSYIGRHHWPCFVGLVQKYDDPGLLKDFVISNQVDRIYNLGTCGLYSPRSLQSPLGLIVVSEHIYLASKKPFNLWSRHRNPLFTKTNANARLLTDLALITVQKPIAEPLLSQGADYCCDLEAFHFVAALNKDFPELAGLGVIKVVSDYNEFRWTKKKNRRL